MLHLWALDMSIHVFYLQYAHVYKLRLNWLEHYFEKLFNFSWIIDKIYKIQ